MVLRYIGSSRPREAGYLATHKQDFNAHVTGGDWVHWADHISVMGPYSNLQLELISIETRIQTLSDVVLGPYESINNTIPIFNGSTGKLLKGTPTSIDPMFGDLIFPNHASFPEGEGYSIIMKSSVTRATPAESLQLYGQYNNAGPGGDLVLGTGLNNTTGKYDGNIRLFTSQLIFDADYAASDILITQESAHAATAHDLSIIAQYNTTGTPGNLWLSSGYSTGLNSSGSINLLADDGGINLLTSNILFGSSYVTPTISQTELASGGGQPLMIRGQSSLNGGGGNLTLYSGEGTSGDGNVAINAGTGQVHLYGTAGGGFGSVNLASSLFFLNGTAPGTPSGGVLVYANGGNLYWKGPDGIEHPFPVT